MERSYTTQNGGCIRIAGCPVPVFKRELFTDGSGIDDCCPFCGSIKVSECADFVQFGILVDVHEIVFWCEICDRPFVIECETKA